MHRLRSIGLTALATLALAGAAMAQQQGAQNRGVIELMNQIETLNAELNKLRGEMEVLNNSLENAQRRQRDMYLDLDTRLRRFESAAGEPGKPSGDLEARIKRLEDAQAGGPTAAAAPTPGPAAAVTTPTPPAPPATPAVPKPAAPAAPAGDASAARRAYDAALNTYRSGDYQGAVAAFDSFVKRYPKDALAPNAQYWIGDAWFNLRDFRAAATAQQTLIGAWPDSPKVPDAMLNLSSAQIALGDTAAARKTLEDLIARFPQNEAAERARQRLAKLK